MMWTWHQAKGLLFREGERIASGYSGNGTGRNNPALQAERGTGPIPAGSWIIADRHDSENTGPCTLTLVPDDGTATFGRSQFRIHGDSIAHPGTASHGCIILPRTVRDAIWRSGDHRLMVVR